MAKFYGKIGFIKTYEEYDGDIPTGIYKKDIIEKSYKGDIIRNNRHWNESTEKTNDDISINNQFSILSNSFATENLAYMRYIEYKGIKWKILSIDIEYPRLILTVGGVYNG